MKHPETRIVTETNGPRPAGPPNRCFYCNQNIGQEHKPDCVIRERSVVLRATIELTTTVPESWTPEQIEFHRNETGWCVNNLLEQALAEDCLCGLTRIDYVREATTEDERRMA